MLTKEKKAKIEEEFNNKSHPLDRDYAIANAKWIYLDELFRDLDKLLDNIEHKIEQGEDDLKDFKFNLTQSVYAIEKVATKRYEYKERLKEEIEK